MITGFNKYHVDIHFFGCRGQEISFIRRFTVNRRNNTGFLSSGFFCEIRVASFFIPVYAVMRAFYIADRIPFPCELSD